MPRKEITGSIWKNSEERCGSRGHGDKPPAGISVLSFRGCGIKEKRDSGSERFFTQNIKPYGTGVCYNKPVITERICDSAGKNAGALPGSQSLLFGGAGICRLRPAEGVRKMRNIELLMAALEYIELHMCDEIKTEDIAASCFCSKSTLEKLFRSVHDVSVHEYIVRRRMMRAAKKISQNPGLPILEIALEYGYSTHESFTRAFEQIWHCKPSEFRRAEFTELFPRLYAPLEKGEPYIMKRKHIDLHVDVEGLYDLFQERKDCFFVLCDIKNLMAFNDEISRKAGDLAILEQVRRMIFAAGEEDIVFRIGNDEFCILTASSREEYAEQIADRIRGMNGQTFAYEEKELSLSLHVSTVSLKECRHREEMVTGLNDAIKQSKK